MRGMNKPAAAAKNPLLADWTGPFGLPPFGAIAPAHFRPGQGVDEYEYYFGKILDIIPIMKLPKEPQYTCTKCGMCCRGFTSDFGVILFPRDVARLSRRLKISKSKFQRTYCVPVAIDTGRTDVKLFMLKNLNGECLFLGANGFCTVYEDRPLQCERTPFKFFWGDPNDFNYACVKNTNVPPDWSSVSFDQELLADVFESGRK
jgi:Fe-S-cluster containining protein